MLIIDSLSPTQMSTKADVIDWNGRKLEGIINVLEALEAPLVDQMLSSTLFELRQLLESMRKVLQVSGFVGTNPLVSHVCASVAQKTYLTGRRYMR